jgi:NAD(P)-dependent dehydrogenase (short-subunit alcohol dehydrogenase family)
MLLMLKHKRCARLSIVAALFASLLLTAAFGAEPRRLQTQICIVGGGSGGVGAALAAARAGVEVLLVERLGQLGGTSTSAYVSGWEPGPGDPFAREIFERLHAAGAAGVTAETNPERKLGPFALWRINPELTYDDSLYRAGHRYVTCHGVVFNPEAMSALMAQLLRETGRCRVLLNTRFVQAETAGPRVTAITACSAEGTAYRVEAAVFIDSTGDVELCRAAGCETMLGAEPKSRFQEPSAPEQPIVGLNGVSLCYRLRKADRPAPPREPDPAVKRFPRSAHVIALPCGDLIVNPLAVMAGNVAAELGREKAYAACKPIVEAHWHWLHQQPPFAGYEFHDFAAMLGVRESYRVVGDYVLTEHDLRAGLAKQQHADIVALADHSMDVHSSGRGGFCIELAGPYGVPLRALLPRGKDNLLVACRGASFSHLAASSCRLSRTILALGHAAGLTAAQAVRSGRPLREVDVRTIQREMKLAKVQQ